MEGSSALRDLRISASCSSRFRCVCREKLGFRCLTLGSLALASKGARYAVMGKQPAALVSGLVPTAVQDQFLPEHNYLLIPRRSLHWLRACQPAPEKCILSALLSPASQISTAVVDLPVFRDQYLRTAGLLGGFFHGASSSAGKRFCVPRVFAFPSDQQHIRPDLAFSSKQKQLRQVSKEYVPFNQMSCKSKREAN